MLSDTNDPAYKHATGHLRALLKPVEGRGQVLNLFAGDVARGRKD